MTFTHAYRTALTQSITHNDSGVTLIVTHSLEYSPYHSHNVVTVDWVRYGVSQHLEASTASDMDFLYWVSPYADKVYPWLHSRLFPESITLGETLAKRLRKQAKEIQAYSEAPHVVYGVARETNGQLRTFFKPCNDKELAQHEKETEGYIYAVH